MPANRIINRFTVIGTVHHTTNPGSASFLKPAVFNTDSDTDPDAELRINGVDNYETIIKPQHGVTLLELIVAITIAGIVTTLGFTLFGYVTKNFSQQTRSVERLRSTMLAKKRIDRAIGRISTLVRSTEREVCGIDGTLDSLITCRYSGTALLAGDDTIATGLGAFRFSVVEERHGAGSSEAVLLWNAELAASGDWIGGAAIVRKNDEPRR